MKDIEKIGCEGYACLNILEDLIAEKAKEVGRGNPDVGVVDTLFKGVRENFGFYQQAYRLNSPQFAKSSKVAINLDMHYISKYLEKGKIFPPSIHLTNLDFG